jgi:hypothetical protein
MAWGSADHADTTSGDLRDLGDLWRGLLAFALGRRRHPQHGNVLAQRRHGLRILRHVEVAADDGEIRLAFAEQMGAGEAPSVCSGRNRTRPVLLVVERLRQRLNHAKIVAVGRPTAIRKVTGRIAK